MARAGPKKTQRYGVAFKRAAVELSRRPGLEVQAVAEALDIHPFMLSRWRKEFREGRLRAPADTPQRRAAKAPLVREHRLLQEEHALLKKAIRFCSARRPRRSHTSRGSAGRSR